MRMRMSAVPCALRSLYHNLPLTNLRDEHNTLSPLSPRLDTSNQIHQSHRGALALAKFTILRQLVIGCLAGVLAARQQNSC